MGYRIHNQNGEVYTVNNHGLIGRPKINLTPSGQWRARALVRFSNFGYTVQRIPFENWDQFIQQGPEWRHQNGKPRYYLEDSDHGTVRIQGTGVLAVTMALL